MKNQKLKTQTQNGKNDTSPICHPECNGTRSVVGVIRQPVSPARDSSPSHTQGQNDRVYRVLYISVFGIWFVIFNLLPQGTRQDRLFSQLSHPNHYPLVSIASAVKIANNKEFSGFRAARLDPATRNS
jgi:hypothetical protein